MFVIVIDIVSLTIVVIIHSMITSIIMFIVSSKTPDQWALWQVIPTGFNRLQPRVGAVNKLSLCLIICVIIVYSFIYIFYVIGLCCCYLFCSEQTQWGIAFWPPTPTRGDLLNCPNLLSQASTVVLGSHSQCGWGLKGQPWNKVDTANATACSHEWWTGIKQVLRQQTASKTNEASGETDPRSAASSLESPTGMTTAVLPIAIPETCASLPSLRNPIQKAMPEGSHNEVRTWDLEPYSQLIHSFTAPLTRKAGPGRERNAAISRRNMQQGRGKVQQGQIRLHTAKNPHSQESRGQEILRLTSSP